MAKGLKDILGESKMPTETQKKILEAWDNKIEESKSELREEFAQKYEHDKRVLAESLDKFVGDKLRVELEELAEDKAKLVQEQVAYKKKLREHAHLLNEFVSKQLATEVAELKGDREKLIKGMKTLENFTINQLSEEIAEFRKDKKALVEQRVKMVKEGKSTINEAREKFVKRSAKLAEATINKSLKKELSQFKDDIKIARENDFGRRIFESFVGEYMSSYLSEGSEVKKMKDDIKAQQDKFRELSEAISKKDEEKSLLESKLRAANDRIERGKVMGRLLSPLNADKRGVMKDLLENVQTPELERAFDKYLPSVLNETTSKLNTKSRRALSESVKEKTGNRAPQAHHNNADEDYLTQIKHLAGLNK